jgi:hypothetical protein
MPRLRKTLEETNDSINLEEAWLSVQWTEKEDHKLSAQIFYFAGGKWVGARFSAPVQTGPRAYPASCAMGTGSFPGVKRPGRGINHPPPSSPEVK